MIPVLLEILTRRREGLRGPHSGHQAAQPQGAWIQKTRDLAKLAGLRVATKAVERVNEAVAVAATPANKPECVPTATQPTFPKGPAGQIPPFSLKAI